MSVKPQLKGLFQARLKTASLVGGVFSVVATVAFYFMVPRRRINTYVEFEKTNTYEKQMEVYERMKNFGVFKKLGPNNSVVTLDDEGLNELKIAGSFK